MKRARTDGGFLLLEVLVASVIAALALAVLLGGVSAGLQVTSLAGRYSQAVALARSHLAAVGGRAASLVPGVEEGSDGGEFHWRVEITPLTAGSALGRKGEMLVLYRVIVTESWKDWRGDRTVRLTSARLGTGGSAGL